MRNWRRMGGKVAALKVVVLDAVDWGIYTEQVPGATHFDIARGTVCGLLVSEDDEKIALTPQRFFDGGMRCTLVIPKCTIISRTDLLLEPKEL